MHNDGTFSLAWRTVSMVAFTCILSTDCAMILAVDEHAVKGLRNLTPDPLSFASRSRNVGGSASAGEGVGG